MGDAIATEVSRAETDIDSAGDVKIHVRRFSAAGRRPERERALLAIVPGFSDHGDRFPRLVRAAIEAGYGAASLDTRGHGLSGGPRGHVRSFDDYLLDVDAFLLWLRRDDGPGEAPPLFIFAHSMGGLIVLSYLSAGYGTGVGLRGAIVQAPWLRLAVTVPRWKRGLARVLRRVAPAVPIASEVHPEALSRDLSVGEAYLKDPLVHGVCTPRLYSEVTATAARILANPRRLPRADALRARGGRPHHGPRRHAKLLRAEPARRQVAAHVRRRAARGAQRPGGGRPLARGAGLHGEAARAGDRALSSWPARAASTRFVESSKVHATVRELAQRGPNPPYS